jgi:hypothetical protein
MLDREISAELERYLLLNYRPEGADVTVKHFVEDTHKKSGGFLPFVGMAGIFRILQGTDSLVRHLDMSFSEKLMWWIKERKRTPVEIYRAAGVTKAHFAKIRNNPQYHPTKETVLAFVIALHLTLEEAKDLLERAGYALSKSHLGDMIVKCFLEMQRYNIDEINEALYIHECKPLTNWRESK